LQTPLEIYGLTGLRQLIRTTLNCTYTHLARRYRVHELLFERDRPYGGYRHRQELEGRDIWIDREKGCWPNFINEGEKMRVSAAPVQHTVPCVGFVFEEAPRLGKIDPKPLIPLLQKNKAALALPPWNLDNPMMVLGLLQQSPNPITLPDGAVIQPPALNTNGRKLVILGDTCDAQSTTMDELAKDADLVVHESTNAFLPGLDDALKDDDTYESIEKKTKSHGHSTPQVGILLQAFCRR
jgi:ribonuclease Z